MKNTYDPTTDFRKYEEEHIITMVRIGLDSDEEIKQQIFKDVETFNKKEEGISEDWITQIIDSEREKVRTESAQWKDFNDRDVKRFVDVFDTLLTLGVVALHNPGWSNFKSISGKEVAPVARALEMYKELNNQGIETRGFCFYTTQNVNLLQDSDKESYLDITFGHDPEFSHKESDNNTCELIVTQLKKAGFKTNYHKITKFNQPGNNLIRIPFFKWELPYHPINKNKFSDTEALRILTDIKLRSAAEASLSTPPLTDEEEYEKYEDLRDRLVAEETYAHKLKPSSNNKQHTVQDELIFNISSLEGEYYRNGFMNWDIEEEDNYYAQCQVFLLKTLTDGTFGQKENDQITTDLNLVKKYVQEEELEGDKEIEDKVTDALTNTALFVMKWREKHPEPIEFKS